MSFSSLSSSPVCVSFPIHSCIDLPPVDIQSSSPEWSLVGITVELKPEDRRSWHSFIKREQIRRVKRHKTIPSGSPDCVSPIFPLHVGFERKPTDFYSEWFLKFQLRVWNGSSPLRKLGLSATLLVPQSSFQKYTFLGLLPWKTFSTDFDLKGVSSWPGRYEWCLSV